MSTLGRVAGAAQAGIAGMDMANNGPNVNNVMNAGLGALTTVAPQIGIPATIANAGMDAGMNMIADRAVAANDIRGPATLAYQARQQGQPRPPAVATQPPATAAPPAAAPAPALPESVTTPIARSASPMMSATPLAYAPQQQPVGPLPTLQPKSGESIFSAMMNLGGDMAKYRDTAIANKQARGGFNDMLKAGKFNLDAIKDKSNIQLAFNDDERKSLDSEIKTRSAEALRLLATGKYEKGQEKGLRLLAGLAERGKYKPAIIYGAPDENGVQQKMTVAVADDGSVIPLQSPGFNTPDKAAALPPGMTKQVGTSGGKPVYQDASGKQFIGK